MTEVVTCAECGADLPCYGRGLSRRGSVLLALVDHDECLRRMKAHVVVLAREAGRAGITRYELAERLGLDPTGESRTERLVHPHFREAR